MAQWLVMAEEIPCSELDLARGVALNDKPSVLAFFAAYHAGVFRYMLCLAPNVEDAEDLAQDSMLLAKAKIRSFRGESSLKTWVHRVAYHTFTHWRRRQKSSSDLPQELASRGEPFRRVDDGELLKSALALVGPALAHPFILQEIGGHSTEEIARILDIPAGTVKSRIHVARRRLRELLGAEEEIHAIR